MKGWVKLHRSIKDHWIFENPDYLKAWLTIIIEVNHAPAKVLIKGELFDCNRGESLKSAQSWVDVFGAGWTRQKLRTFFKLLEKDQMINQRGMRKTTKLTVCNYDTYQSEQPTNNQQTNQQITNKQPTDNQQITTNKNDKNKKNKREEKELKLFDFFRKSYPGTKRGNETEFNNLKKKHADWKIVLSQLEQSLKDQKISRANAKANNKFVPEWKNLSTWINGRCWEEEGGEQETQTQQNEGYF